jgi:hypothetical protein
MAAGKMPATWRASMANEISDGIYLTEIDGRSDEIGRDFMRSRQFIPESFPWAELTILAGAVGAD